MRLAVGFFLILPLLVSCAPVETPQSVPTAEPSLVVPPTTATFIAPSPTFTPVPSPSPTPTATPDVCDPFAKDFCITEGYFPFERPIKPPADVGVDPSYLYGTTARGTRDPHHGVEFVSKFGTPVHAAGDGTVVFAGADTQAIYGRWSNFYGNLIVIQHGDDIYTLYAHLSKIHVQAGETVLGGDAIGEVGQSGVAIGPHLHFEVRRGDVEDPYSTRNPELWLVPNQNVHGMQSGVIQLSVVDEQGLLIKYTEFTAEYFADRGQPARRAYYGVTYSKDMLNGEENAVLGDVPAGSYRIVLTYNGQLYERWVEVESGKLTQVVIAVK